MSLKTSTVLASCGDGTPGPCPSDALNGYFPSSARFGNGEGFFTENTGFKLPGGGTADWREGAYASDNWKIVPNFTLTAGVRWSVDTDRANQDLPTPPCSAVDPSLQSPCTGNGPLLEQFQAGFSKKIHQPYANFGPQLGFAYSPGDHKTVVRAAFGVFYESDVFTAIQATQQPISRNTRGGRATKQLLSQPRCKPVLPNPLWHAAGGFVAGTGDCIL